MAVVLALAPVQISDFTLTTTFNSWMISCSTGNTGITATLPPAVGLTGTYFVIRRLDPNPDTNPCVVVCDGSDYFNEDSGLTFIEMFGQDVMEIYSDGVDSWKFISKSNV